MTTNKFLVNFKKLRMLDTCYVHRVGGVELYYTSRPVICTLNVLEKEIIFRYIVATYNVLDEDATCPEADYCTNNRHFLIVLFLAHCRESTQIQ